MTEAWIGLIGLIGGIILNRLFDLLVRKDKVAELEKKMEESEEERCLMCYALQACLDGLVQLGANHEVPIAKEKMKKYLNKKAHGQEE